MAAAKVKPREVRCPTCGAEPGERCVGSATGPSRGGHVDNHHYRREAARFATEDAQRAAQPVGGTD